MKQETLKEVKEIAEKKYGTSIYDFEQVDAFIEGAKWQQEQDKNKYSEEEVITFLLDCRSENPIDAEKWFEQVKKK
jgi:hypothetical protein